jgi:hypothetical protein
VNIIFESHGNIKEGLVLGKQYLNGEDFERSLRAFAHGVQVNAISCACYSGAFKEVIETNNQSSRFISVASGAKQKAWGTPRSVSNRCRGARYEHAWVQSFARLRVFGDAVSEDPPARTVAEHEQYIKDNIHRNFPNKPVVQDPDFFASEPTTLAMAIEDLVVKDKIDILYDPQTTHRRRRIEWPTENPNFLHILNLIRDMNLQNPSFRNPQEAVGRLESEASKSDQDSGLECDIPIFDNWLIKKPFYISERLVVLYYRGRIQSAFFDTFMMLVQRGFLTIENLRKPMALWEETEDVGIIRELLGCFNGITREFNMELNIENQPHPLWDCETTLEASRWLATIIVRGCADLPNLLETIIASGFLGTLNDAAFEKYKKEYPVMKAITCYTDERVAQQGASLNAYFGFWLPHGFGSMTEAEIYDELAQCIKRFDDIERIFKSWFGIPDYMILRADQQARYLDEHADKCPPRLKEYLTNEAAYRSASYSKSLRSGEGGFQRMRIPT